MIRPVSTTQTRSGVLDARPGVVLAGFLVLTLAVYWPALAGGYFFDDAVYFFRNPDIRVTTLHLGDWMRAALSQAGINPLVRPLSALTFAANYYFSGVDPFWPKLTNVLIHLLNGWLLFRVLLELFALDATVRGTPPRRHAAALIAGAWLLLPINLTAVAYVSQRMETLATVFVLVGLVWYLKARRLHYERHSGGHWLWLGIALCTALGLTAKEDAALLPLYTACVEFAITRFRDADGKRSRATLWTHFVVLVVPLVAGVAWIMPRVLHGVTVYRNFTIGERLLTEPRVLLDYIQWTILPSLSSLTFYHDDIEISHGLLAPPSTLFALLALAGLLAVAVACRRARPLLCLGILWFFAGHSMTGTVVPLEIAFEHRNYFPSIGLLLAIASLLALETNWSFKLARTIGVGAFFVLCTFTTLLRAQEWSDPIRLAYAEALKRPASPRAQYELARTLIVASGKRLDSPLITEATGVLERNAYAPATGILPLQALIYVNARAGRPIDPRWWQAISSKLKTQPIAAPEVNALIFLMQCQEDGDCPRQTQELLDAFLSALDHSGNSDLTSAYAQFALVGLEDVELAGRMYRAVVAQSPGEPTYRANLVKFLIETRQFDDARHELAEMAKLNKAGSLDSRLAALQQRLEAAERESNNPDNASKDQ